MNNHYLSVPVNSITAFFRSPISYGTAPVKRPDRRGLEHPAVLTPPARIRTADEPGSIASKMRKANLFYRLLTRIDFNSMRDFKDSPTFRHG
jgi:hypothetical protein